MPRFPIRRGMPATNDAWTHWRLAGSYRDGRQRAKGNANAASGEVRSVLTILRGYFVGQTVRTTLTANCYAETAATFDLNDSTWVTFFVLQQIPCWQVLLSIANPQVVLTDDITTAGVELCKGLTVMMNSMGKFYTVTMTGTIIDNGTKSDFTGAVLASFTRASAMKQAVRSIRSGGIR